MKDLLVQNSPYRMQLLVSDLQHEELIHQVAESLDQLKVVVDDVFTNVERKIAANKSRLAKINERAKLAQVKVDKLKGRKKATQVSNFLQQKAVMFQALQCKIMIPNYFVFPY